MQLTSPSAKAKWLEETLSRHVGRTSCQSMCFQQAPQSIPQFSTSLPADGSPGSNARAQYPQTREGKSLLGTACHWKLKTLTSRVTMRTMSKAKSQFLKLLNS